MQHFVFLKQEHNTVTDTTKFCSYSKKLEHRIRKMNVLNETMLYRQVQIALTTLQLAQEKLKLVCD